MRVHNLVEDLVVQKVEELLADAAPTGDGEVTLDAGAKSDVVCYVLNRTPTRYVVSGRGIAHSETADYQSKVQQLADITRLVREGIETVRRHQRDRGPGASTARHQGPFFNFPSIIGRMFNGGNFEPVHDVTVGLYHEGRLVEVIDPNWQNPYRLVVNTAGTYLFWPHPRPAEQVGTEATFEFELRVEDPRFEPLRYFFPLTSRSEGEFIDFVNTTASTRLKDLYLFPRD